ncbi:MAG TPA: hypothetical protein VFU15_04005 [Bacteroidia bacterium]|nr:hypothetical protein [Bacteroidia bacterium]
MSARLFFFFAFYLLLTGNVPAAISKPDSLKGDTSTVWLDTVNRSIVVEEEYVYVEVLDGAGRLVTSSKNTFRQMRIDMKGKPAGAYTVKVKNNRLDYSRTIILPEE